MPGISARSIVFAGAAAVCVAESGDLPDVILSSVAYVVVCVNYDVT